MLPLAMLYTENYRKTSEQGNSFCFVLKGACTQTQTA